MSAHRARRVTTLFLVACAAVLGVAAFVARHLIVETWSLHAYERAATPAARTEALRSLGRWGAARSVPPCLQALDDELLQAAAAEALTSIAPRLASRDRRQLVRSLLTRPAPSARSATPPGPDPVLGVLREIARTNGDALRELVGAFESDMLLAPLAVRATLERFESAEEEVLDLLREVSHDALINFFFVAALSKEGMFTEFGETGVEMTAALRLGSSLVARHPDPRARAILLSFQVQQDGFAGGAPNLAPAVAAYASDPSPIVKVASLRIAGFLGSRPGTIDLSRELLTAEDAELLTAAIEARGLWLRQELASGGFELYAGCFCNWISRSHEAVQQLPWAEAEIARLESILQTRREAGLRDAASHALARHSRAQYVEGQDKSANVSAPFPIPGFRVAEWGVWVDAGGVLESPSQQLEDLPAFVHRSQVSSDEYFATIHSPMQVFKPVVFFQSPHPLAVDFEVHFQGGRPWTYYPAPTDLPYSADLGAPNRAAGEPQDRDSLLGLAPRASALFGTDDGSGVAIRLAGSNGIDPPWIAPGPADGAPANHSLRAYYSPRERATSLRGFYADAPWILPRSPMWPPPIRRSKELGNMGLEWCGLRVGHAADLEAAELDAGSCPWWPLLREVGASRVGLRGESDRLLFYDGVIDMRGPVHVSWAGAARDVLALGARSFGEYPEVPSSFRESERWRLSDAEKGRLSGTAPIPFVFVIGKRDGEAAHGAVLERLDPEAPPRLLPLAKLDLTGAQLTGRFERALRSQGLNEAESHSLVATWQRELFELPGLRAVAVLPQWIYDAMLPARLFPLPEAFVRVGLVLRELRDLEVGTASWGLGDPAARWQPRPWPMPRQPRQLLWVPWSFGEELPLELAADGSVVLDRSKPCALDLSADGQALAFALLDDETYEVWLADLGRRTRRLVERFGGVSMRMRHGGALLVDGVGGRLVYSVGENPSQNQTLVADLRASRRIDLGQIWPHDLSRDGRKLLEGFNASHRVLDLDSGASITVFHSDVDGVLQRAALSGDGSRVALDFRERVLVIDLAAEKLYDLSGTRGRDQCALLSSDGARILFESNRTRDWDIYYADLTARTFENLTRRPGEDRCAGFLDDERSILLRDGEARTFVVRELATGKQAPIPGTEHVWNVQTSDRRRVAFLRHDDDRVSIVVRDL